MLNPNASDLLPLRKWSTDRFVALGKRLLEEHPDAIIAITGAPAEKDAAQSIANEISTDRAVSLAGHTTLEQLMVLYCISSILVTNDSGPGHFSSMTTVDSVVLFGPETPLLFGPLGSNSHVIWAGISCSPCVNAVNQRFSPCDNNVCMQDISVGQVLAEVNRILHRRSTNAKALPVLAGVS